MAESGMLKRVIAFADGENLVFRFQAMLDGGRVARGDISHIRDAFVWSPQLTLWSEMDLIRVQYYTSVVGDEQKVADVENKIAATLFQCKASGSGYQGAAQLIPRVHKKPQASLKTKVVDVDITMDVMRAAMTMPID